MRNIKVLVGIEKLTVVVAIAHSYDQDGPQSVSSRRKVAKIISIYVGNFGEQCAYDHEREASEEAWDFAEKAYNKYYSVYKKR